MTDTAANFVADTLEQSTAQFFGALTQTTKFMLETVSAIVDSLAKTPLSVPQLPLAPSKETVKEWLDVTFETTQQLLKLQHELVTEMVERFPFAGAS